MTFFQRYTFKFYSAKTAPCPLLISSSSQLRQHHRLYHGSATQSRQAPADTYLLLSSSTLFVAYSAVRAVCAVDASRLRIPAIKPPVSYAQRGDESRDSEQNRGSRFASEGEGFRSHAICLI